jgi:hypothetical protein
LVTLDRDHHSHNIICNILANFLRPGGHAFRKYPESWGLARWRPLTAIRVLAGREPGREAVMHAGQDADVATLGSPASGRAGGEELDT